MNAHCGRRLLAVVLVLVGVWAILVGRLVDLQVLHHRFYWSQAQARQTQRTVLAPLRGSIVDRSGVVLAEDIESSDLVACPALIAGDAGTIRLLASTLHLTEADVRARLARSRGYVRLARNLPPETEHKLRAARRPGLSFQRTTVRAYPRESLAAAVLGRAGADGHGLEGLELAYDSVLRGSPGWATMVRDGHGAVYPDLLRTISEPVDGTCIDLTIDADLQSIAEDELARGLTESRAKGGTAIILDPRSGDVLAMASLDGPRAGHSGMPRNRAIADQFEPGSTFKIVVAAAAIEERLVSPRTPVFCENGHWRTDDWNLHDAHKHGLLSFCDVIAQSSNIGTAKVGLRLGRNGLYDYARAFGFGRSTGIGLPAEVGGRLTAPASWSARSLPTISIGQEVSVTPLQVAMAYSAIANDGVLMAPRLVRALRRSDGRLVRATEPRAIRRIVSEETARTVRTFLAATVDSGTAKAAQIEWAHVGGKTGTAEKYDPVIHTYGRGKYFASFVGMLPIEAPTLVCLVTIDEPEGAMYYGGLVAAPIWRAIVESIGRLPHAPVRPEYRRVVPDREAWAAAVPEPEAPVAVPVVQTSGPDSAYTGPVAPDVMGRPLRDALRELRAHDLLFAVDGAGVVHAQTPLPGEPVHAGELVHLVCGPAVTAPARRTSRVSSVVAAARTGVGRD